MSRCSDVVVLVGFIRLTLVPLAEMKSKAAHARNAFHYSCWGATPVVATGSDLNPPDEFGFTMTGTDGAQHSFAKGYYKLDAEIPDVVPDGKFMLGFYDGWSAAKFQTWLFSPGPAEVLLDVDEDGGGTHFGDPSIDSGFGAVLGVLKILDLPYLSHPSTPRNYWSCAFVEIEGGAPLVASYTPKFINDMSQFSTEGCMSATDRLGTSGVEPCVSITAKYRKPAVFLNGGPKPLTPAQFGVSAQ